MLDLSRLQHRDLDPLDNDLGLLYPLELGNPPAKLPRIFFFGLFNDAGQTCAQPFQVHRGERLRLPRTAPTLGVALLSNVALRRICTC